MSHWSYLETPHATQSPPREIHQSMAAYLWRRHGADISWLTAYVFANSLVFWLRFREYPQDPCVGYGPAIAKGSAEVVMLNCVLALISVCHRVNDRLRLCASTRGVPSPYAQRPAEMHRQFHALAGSATVVMSLVHSVTWLLIVYWARSCGKHEWSESALARRRAKIVREEESVGWLLLKLPMWTGLAMMVGVVFLLPFCIPFLRRRFFQIFEALHAVVLFPFLALLLFHGANEWSSHLQAPIWLVPTLLVYILERRSRLSLDSSSTIVCFGVSATHPMTTIQPQKTIRVFLAKTKRFLRCFEAGMFVYLQVPVISSLEWHPFSVCSCQDDTLVELRIRVVGDWTAKLLMLLGAISDRDDGTLTPAAVPVRIDGPFGTPTAQFLQYDEVALLAMGIGVSPFFSVLRHQLHAWRHLLKLEPLTASFSPRMTLVWVVRDVTQIDWLTEILDEFDDITAKVIPRFLSIQIFVTGQVETAQLARAPGLVLHAKGCRPDWMQVITAWASSSSAGASRAAFVSGSRHATSAIKRAAATIRGVDVYAESFR